jgi:hypothetical protein
VAALRVRMPSRHPKTRQTSRRLNILTWPTASASYTAHVEQTCMSYIDRKCKQRDRPRFTSVTQLEMVSQASLSDHPLAPSWSYRPHERDKSPSRSGIRLRRREVMTRRALYNSSDHAPHESADTSRYLQSLRLSPKDDFPHFGNADQIRFVGPGQSCQCNSTPLSPMSIADLTLMTTLYS